MDEKDQAALFSKAASGGTDNWITPDNVLEIIREFNGGRSIGYDPCHQDGDRVGAVRNTHLPDDGLQTTWTGKGLVFVNPPYSKVALWAAKAYAEFSYLEETTNVVDHPEDECIMLIPARTDTRWWQAFASTCTAICFWKGRIRFQSTDPEKALNSAPFPSAFLYWGCRPDQFASIFSKHGMVVR